MTGKFVVALAAVGSLSAFGAPALADVVFNQAGNGQACNPSCWTSSLATDGSGGFRTYDNFTLGQAATIGSVSWQGFYDDYATPANNPVAPATLSWTIGFFADAAGLPGAQLYTTTLTAAQVTTTFLDVSSFGNPVNVYSFTATLPIGFAAAAGTTYWFSPLSNQTDLNPIFSWSNAAALPGGSSAQTTFAGSTSGTAAGAMSRSGDRAFSLSSAATASVPEPATWATFICGFGMIGGAMRRRGAVKPTAAAAAGG